MIETIFRHPTTVAAAHSAIKSDLLADRPVTLMARDAVTAERARSELAREGLPAVVVGDPAEAGWAVANGYVAIIEAATGTGASRRARQHLPEILSIIPAAEGQEAPQDMDTITPLTMPEITEIVARGKLATLDDRTLHDIARTVTEARAAAERRETPDDIGLLDTRNAIWAERAQRRAEYAVEMVRKTLDEGGAIDALVAARCGPEGGVPHDEAEVAEETKGHGRRAAAFAGLAGRGR